MNRFKIAWLVIGTLLYLLSAPLFAQVVTPEDSAATEFNEVYANKVFDAISIKLSTQSLDADHLKKAITTIEKLNRQAQRCIDDNQSKISLLEDFSKQSQLSKAPNIAQNADYQYLQNKISEYTKKAAGCRLFMIRTQVALVAYKQTIQKLSTERILQRSTPIWHLASKLTFPSFKNIHYLEVYSLSGISLLKNSDYLILSILIIIGYALGVYASKLLHLLTVTIKSARSRRLLREMNKATLISLPIIVMISCYFSLVFYEIEPSPALKLLSYGIFCLLLTLIAAKAIIFSFPRLNMLKGLSLYQVKPIYPKLRLILLWIFSYYFIFAIFRQQPIPQNIVEPVTSLFFGVLIILTIRFFAFSISILCFKMTNPIRNALKTVVISAFSVILIVQLAGYHRLVIYIYFANILTLLLTFVTWSLIKFNESFCNFLESNRSQASQRFRYYLGIKPYKKIGELMLIRIALLIVILSIYSVLFLKIWKISVIYSDEWIGFLLSGFKFGELAIYPSRILLAAIIFGISLLCGRFIATHVARHHEFEGEKDTQVAVASIVKYAWIAIAVIITLLISGFNFTNLAIIAGAFSVGIGLGMQHIVTNFVSGLILLLEKPIKPGDRIAVNGIDGYVRKIRARSTQITTTLHEDLIVPNSDLINRPVTNYMFNNRTWKLTCSIGVAYNSDIDLVQHLLLELAYKHPAVITEDKLNKPSVCFQEFGSNSLNFKLWCLIKDVNDRYQVLSELNSAIFHTFKQHNIEIAYPQLDVHIKKE